MFFEKPSKMNPDKLYLMCKCVLALSIAFACIYTPLTITKQIDLQLTGLRKDAKIEIQDTRKAAVKEIQDTRLALVKEIQDTRKDTVYLVNTRFDSLQGYVDAWIQTADTRIGSIQTDAFTRLDAFSVNVNNQLTTTNKHIGNLTDTYTALPVKIGSRFNEQTNCEVNRLCWQNIATDMMIDARYGFRDFSESSKVFKSQFPIFVDNTNKITTNFAGITHNIDVWTHPRWYEKLLGYTVKGAQIYTLFNQPTQAITGTITTVVQSGK